jgi:hypothetical protein
LLACVRTSAERACEFTFQSSHQSVGESEIILDRIAILD